MSDRSGPDAYRATPTELRLVGREIRTQFDRDPRLAAAYEAGFARAADIALYSASGPERAYVATTLADEALAEFDGVPYEGGMWQSLLEVARDAI
jgi:hypothetical protein